MIALARKTLVYEWRRFVPVVLAVGFSGLMLVAQAALVLGIFGTAAIYVKASSADLWVGYPGTQSVNFGQSIDPDVAMRLRMDPDVLDVEPYEWVDGDWRAQASDSGSVSVYLSGVSVSDGAMMFDQLLGADMRARLREPGAVIVDEADLQTLGLNRDVSRAWINGKPVRVVGLLRGLRGLGGVNVLASVDTAREVKGEPDVRGSTYYVARTRIAPELVQARLNDGTTAFGPYEVWTADQFASRSQRYWLLDTGAGMAVLFMALIVCLVGAVITNQSFAAVVAGSAREYATLNALGASRTALARVVIEQSCMVGGMGMVLAAVISSALLALAALYHVPVAMTPLVALACAVLVGLMSLLSSVMAVRVLWRTDPSLLLR
ncbi:ABC transporter permease [Alcaligenes sp. A-TC2]|uniref:ABC transporter permease n=2 Tax=Alcaligenes TaxID=507 RepID=A0AAE9HBB4_ALCFA|nr:MULTISPECIES: ABC transporter permease [Alcaligenes]MDH4867736.1 ABC transporter permease [Bacillus cereus]KGP02745.1 ABC transporter permease [Alcaligenes faecalis]KVX05708.1 ABC transporter permease [Alcaligenes faecalis]MCX5473414.1 ABC transporter permease [Alcaligenes nematophilus]MDY7129045.1 ABC transporter permease [Alcaligenes nematophilus]